jgi:hypothetical protein
MASAELESSLATVGKDQRLIAGRYRTHARIGHGRLGEIFAATDEIFDEIGVEQHPAIQIVPENVVANNKLFNQLNVGYSELRAGAHPNIVNYRHFGRNGKFGFLTMELLKGASLRQVLGDAGTLPLEEVKPVIHGVGEALHFLHAKDILHGNLTTGSVFITENLEVRLLDVLPLDPSEALVRGIATSDPFSRCTVEDEVFSLACLAYEMLAGKHPFNHSAPSEAKMAGLEAERIKSLTDGEWESLRLALSFDREQRPSSIADFMRDFDIGGTERLRPTVAQTARHESIEYPKVAESSSITRPEAPVQSRVTETPVVAVESVSSNESGAPIARQIQKRGGPGRAILLGMLLACLGAWSYFGQLEEHMVDLIGYVDARINVAPQDQGRATVDLPVADPGPPIPPESVTPEDQPAAALPTVAEATPEGAEAERSEAEFALPEELTTVALASPLDQPATDVSPEAELVISESFVAVSEGDGSARVVIQRIEKSGMPLVWWTSEHTANNDMDFISMPQRDLPDVSTEDSYVLLIPLVNDSLPEPPESFFVNVGFRDTQAEQFRRIATIRVDIIDDD